MTDSIANKPKIYFPNLNGIRCIAALLVIFHHIEQYKSIFGIVNYWGTSKFISIIGSLGVDLFFVLSGFLITYLLLFEEKNTNSISIKDFYVRRILRIWPLYFLIIILALFILPEINYFRIPGFTKETLYNNFWLKIVLYFTFFANLVLAYIGVVPYASQTWSIGTEEQFYLIWPVILKFITKNRIFLMVFIILVYLTVKVLLDSFVQGHGLSGYWAVFKIDIMAIGGLMAVLSFSENWILKIIQNRIIFYFALLITVFLLSIGYHFPLFHDEFYAILFGIIILNFAKTENIYLSLEFEPLKYLGKVSYGLYMYHPIAILISIKICLSLNLSTNYVLYPFSVLLTIFISAFSYQIFENRFLRVKDRFSRLLSGDGIKMIYHK